MAKSGSQRVSDYRRGKANINIWVAPDIKKRFVEIAASYQLCQSEFFEKLIDYGAVIPTPVKKRVKAEEEEALARLYKCDGDYDKAIHELVKECKAINPNFAYNKRPSETAEEAKLRKKFRRIRSKLLAWKREASN